MSSTSEWLHFHPNNTTTAMNNNISSLGQVAPSYAATSPPDLFFSGLVSEATTVSTTATPLQPGSAQFGPEGRVTKPSRRRTRASRRTPTTLLSTDTANFRAMVQQFTGGPSLGPQGFNVGPSTGPSLGYGLQYGAPTSSNNNSSIINSNLFMQRSIMGDNIYSNAAYVTNTGSNNNHNVNGGSSSSENRSSNNSFQF